MSLVIGEKIDCKCTTVQGLILPVETRQCVALVKSGWFDPTAEVTSAKAENIAYLNSMGRGQDGGDSGSSITGKPKAVESVGMAASGG